MNKQKAWRRPATQLKARLDAAGAAFNLGHIERTSDILTIKGHARVRVGRALRDANQFASKVRPIGPLLRGLLVRSAQHLALQQQAGALA